MMNFEELLILPFTKNAEIIQKYTQTVTDLMVSYEHLNFLANLKKFQDLDFPSTSRVISSAENFSAIISCTIQDTHFNLYRFLLSITSQKTSSLIPLYFDKILFNFDDKNFCWTRNIDCQETDCIEITLSELPQNTEVVLYPNPPISFYAVPDCLKPIVNADFDFQAHVFQSVSQYISDHNLIKDGNIHCDTCLQQAFKVDILKKSHLKTYLKAVLLPIPPIHFQFSLEPNQRENFEILLPSLSFPETAPPVLNLKEILSIKEKADLLAAIARNPVEAICAELTSHSVHCELSDENNVKGPVVSVESLNSARRSTLLFQQPWVTEHARKFVDEVKKIHDRY